MREGVGVLGDGQTRELSRSRRIVDWFGTVAALS